MPKTWRKPTATGFSLIGRTGPRSGTAKTAEEFANKGYCSSKDMCYYGVKFHQIGLLGQDSLPKPGIANLSPAAEHDSLFLPSLSGTPANLALFGNKAYCGEDLRDMFWRSGT